MSGNITEEQLLGLGFEIVHVSAEESGDTPFHYYEYKLGSMWLLSSAGPDTGYSVGFLDYSEFLITNYHELTTIMHSLVSVLVVEVNE